MGDNEVDKTRSMHRTTKNCLQNVGREIKVLTCVTKERTGVDNITRH
jgi:hypothetical protein